VAHLAAISQKPEAKLLSQGLPLECSTRVLRLHQNFPAQPKSARRRSETGRQCELLVLSALAPRTSLKLARRKTPQAVGVGPATAES
jgi:hypothetical protein